MVKPPLLKSGADPSRRISHRGCPREPFRVAACCPATGVYPGISRGALPSATCVSPHAGCDLGGYAQVAIESGQDAMASTYGVVGGAPPARKQVSGLHHPYRHHYRRVTQPARVSIVRRCEGCGGRLPRTAVTGRPAVYCSSACRQRAYRQRGGRASGTPGAERARRARSNVLEDQGED